MMWTDEAKDRWYADNDGEVSAEVVTHVVAFRPEIRIAVVVPPWADPDAVLDEAVKGWAEGLEDHGEHWTNPLAGALLVSIDVLGATVDVGPGPIYRKALIAAHPDHGGTAELLEQVRDAGRKLGVA